jgi:hypothetical protein
VRAADPRCSCGGRGEASRGGRAWCGGGGLDLGHRINGASLRRRSVVRAADARCSCGGRGQASRGGGGLGQGRTGAAVDCGGFATGGGLGEVGRAREVGWAPRSQRRDTRPERRQSHGCGEANAVLRTIFFSSSHFLAVETTSHLSRGMSGYISTTTWLY